MPRINNINAVARARRASGRRIRDGLVLLLLCLAVSAPAFAEVIDKEPTLPQIWGWVLVFGLVGVVLCRLCPWCAAFTLFASYAVIDSVQDPFTGPAILEEAGLGYVLLVYLAFTFLVLCQVYGIYLYANDALVVLDARLLRVVICHVIAYLSFVLSPALYVGQPFQMESIFSWMLSHPLLAISEAAVLLCLAYDLVCLLLWLRRLFISLYRIRRSAGD